MCNEYIGMREITYEDYQKFAKNNDSVKIGESTIKLNKGKSAKIFEPQNFTLERTTVWSFPNRGKWATHRGNYRGNWSPYIPRNLILKYT